MGPYFAVISTRLDRSPLEAARLPRDRIAVLLGEYKYLAESMAGQYGSLHSAFASEGHMFLFESPDAALQYALKLIEAAAPQPDISSLVRDSPYAYPCGMLFR